MYSIGILSVVLLALAATTNAIECRPVLCRLACLYGFDVDTQGCPICTCRLSPNVCIDPILGYSCGLTDRSDCPSSHQCQMDFIGLSGQCCLKRADPLTVTSTTTARSTTTKPHTTTTKSHTTTTKPHTTTTKPHTTTTKHHSTTTKHHSTTTKPHTTTTRRVFNRMATWTTGAAGGSSTRRSVTGGSSAAPSTRRWVS